MRFWLNWRMAMPKTHRLERAAIADWNNLAWAMGRACRGKRRNPAVQALLNNADRALGEIAEALVRGHLPVGRFQAFEIHDPKRRLIHAAPLVDRVAHHALVRHMEPVLERVLLPSVFACRAGRGVHAAISYAQKQARRFPWVMHLDIAHYFPAIDHARLRAQLRRRFRGDGLTLVDAVIDAHGAESGRGLPIGALTSQHFANHYLDPADRWALAQPETRAHCRYMDDTLIWSDDRAGLKRFRDRFIGFLADEWALEVKPPLIQRSDQGILFCGIHVRPHILRASRRRRQRFRQCLDHWQKEWLAGHISDLELQHAHDAARAILLPADDSAWRKQCLNLGARIDA
jgi:hypothetical protein